MTVGQSMPTRVKALADTKGTTEQVTVDVATTEDDEM
jgi:hypothetical protein